MIPIVTTYSILTTLLVGSLLMCVLILMMPFLTKRYSVEIVIAASFLILLRLLLPYELPFTHEVELIYGLPHVQTFLNNNLFGIFPVKNTIIVIWATGAIVRFLYKYLNAAARGRRRFIRICPEWSSAFVRSVMHNLRAEKSWTFRYAIYQNTEVTRIPMVHGIFKAKIYLPNYDYDEKTLRNILEHECIHFRQKDNALILCLNVFFAVYWFIPFQEKIRTNFNSMREYRCDAIVLNGRGHQDREDYIDSIRYIINESNGIPSLDSLQMLERRIELIQNPVYVRPYRKVLFFITLFACLALSFAFVIQPRGEPAGFNEGEDHAGSFSTDEKAYAVLNEDNSVTIFFEGEEFNVSFNLYSESFGELPLYKESESEDAKNEQK